MTNCSPTARKAPRHDHRHAHPDHDDGQGRATRQTAPGVDSLDAPIDQACRSLALPTIRDRFAEIAESCLRQQASYRTFPLELLEAEVEHRDERRRDRLAREARFRRLKRIDDFDFTANPNVTPEVINTLTEPAWSPQGSNPA